MEKKNKKFDLGDFEITKGISNEPKDEKVVSETGKPEEVITLSKTELYSIIHNIVDKKLAVIKDTSEDKSISSDIAQAIQKLIPEKQQKLSTATTLDNIDYDDVLAEPVTFFAYSYSFSFFGYKKYGREIDNPFGRPIQFNHLYRYAKGTGRHREWVNMCVAKIYSKKEAEYVRNNPLFGVRFFEDIGRASSVDVSFAQLLSDAGNSISMLNEHQIVHKAISMGISASTDVEDMRKKLIYKIAEDTMRDQKQKAQSSARDMNMTPDEIGKIAKVAVV